MCILITCCEVCGTELNEFGTVNSYDHDYCPCSEAQRFHDGDPESCDRCIDKKESMVCYP